MNSVKEQLNELKKAAEIEKSCTDFKLQILEESNRNLKLCQLQANVETCNCASKLVHARCVMRDLEVDLIHQRFKVDQARKRILKDKSDAQAQGQFQLELKAESGVISSQRDAFHETTKNLISLLDDTSKRK